MLSDLTLPIIVALLGASFNRIMKIKSEGCCKQVGRAGLGGPQRCLDAHRLSRMHVPCSFFCMTTNMTRGEPTVHQQGLLWKLVRASMTIVGLIPPVYENGDLLIDGGYLNNMPVDVMRGLGVDTVTHPPVTFFALYATAWPDLVTYYRPFYPAVLVFLQVIVVDVEDRDDSVWHNLTPLDGGLSGWHLLWDRWCPIPSLRCCSQPTKESKCRA